MKHAQTFMVVAAAGGILGLAGTASAAPWKIWAAQHGGPIKAHRSGGGGGGGGGTDSFPNSDNFDSYATGPWPCPTPGPSCAGVNGWSLWGVAETSTNGVPGPNNGTIVNTGAHSAPNALLFGSAVDIVQTGNVTSGQWDVSINTFVPSGVTTPASASAYLIIMNAYVPPTFANSNWSVQVQMNQITGALINADTGAQVGNVIFDQWIPLRCHIDIDADTYTVYYNNALSYGPLPYSSGFTAGGAHAIACIDLFSDDSVGVKYDDFSIHQASSCYANCDGSTTVPFLNVNDFVCFQGLFAAGNSAANCDGSTSPPVLNISDFVCFQGLFAAGCSAP
jgi:hypothetical protein